MKILGIDPGLATVGYGVIDYIDNNKISLIDCGIISTDANTPFPERLRQIEQGIIELIDSFMPNAVAFEELFFNKNVKTALQVAHARGVALLAAYGRTKELYEYTPLQVKQAVVGYGRADKNQVQQMVKIMCNLTEVPKPDDAAVAVAIAICHAHSSFNNYAADTKIK